MTTANTNNRASLLAGLRTGGVRSSSINVPHTAAPTSACNVPRFPSQHYHNSFPEDEEGDQLANIPQQPMLQNRNIPMTAAVDGLNSFSQQQGARGMNPNSIPFSPAFVPNMSTQAQMQMLQLEMMRIQALQTQQYQAEILAQAQRQQIQQQQVQSQIRERRTSLGFNPPATAGPMTNSFDLRAATLSAQMRRSNQADQLRSQLGVRNASDDTVPMTAALGGRFGSRTASLNVPSNLPRPDEHVDPPPSPSATTVISGGTSLGNPASNNGNTYNVVLSKSDSASSWRRGGNNNSVLSASRVVSSPSVKVTPPPNEDQQDSPRLTLSPITATAPKFRPQPLQFSSAVSQSLPTVAIDTADEDTDGDTQSSGSSVKSSSPTTPRSSSSNEMPLSPREEASKRLFEGLGIGRPVSATPSDQGSQQLPTGLAAPVHRMVSQPTRQPRGPPSGADELGPKNFATRIRRKAIGGLGMLMGARERREFVEAY